MDSKSSKPQPNINSNMIDQRASRIDPIDKIEEQQRVTSQGNITSVKSRNAFPGQTPTIGRGWPGVLF